jgi:large conductance mechanosensitive channel
MKGFRTFILRGNVVDLAVGIVIGAAFSAVVSGFVAAFLTPIVGLVTGAKGNIGSKHFTTRGVQFPYGVFLQALITFLILAALIYWLVVLPLNKLMERFNPHQDTAAPQQDCPECLSTIPAGARRCAFCTTELLPPARRPEPSPTP